MVSRSQAPSLPLILSEGRAVFELNAFYSLRLLMRHFPKGDGHPVIVLPGFMASDFSTRPMRGLLKDLGYATYGWGLGRNVVFNEQREMDMRSLLKRVHDAEGRKVSLVGWSLGGVFAREITKANPEYVRGVISLGSPISGNVQQTNASALFTAINGEPTPGEAQRYTQLNVAPPVPTTSVYTKTDGIVSWRDSVQQPSHQTENIEVPASHLGLGVNPLVMYAIADRLMQDEGAWQPFDNSGWKKFLFRKMKDDT